MQRLLQGAAIACRRLYRDGERPGFAAFKEVNVIVQVGQTTEVTPHLATAGATTSVEVTGEAPILNFESPDISSVLTVDSLENLPLNGGRWSDMTLLTPAAVGDSSGFGLIAFRGISPILNNVEIDGADDNQAYYSEERGRTREGYSTSKFMIEEFQVNTGVYSAEFGRAAGGVINAVTRAAPTPSTAWPISKTATTSGAHSIPSRPTPHTAQPPATSQLPTSPRTGARIGVSMLAAH